MYRCQKLETQILSAVQKFFERKKHNSVVASSLPLPILTQTRRVLAAFLQVFTLNVSNGTALS